MRIQTQQSAGGRAFHGFGGGRERGFNLAGCYVELPVDTRVFHKGIGMLAEQGDGLGLVIRQYGCRQIALARRKMQHPLIGAAGLPVAPRRAKHRVVRHRGVDQQGTRIGGADSGLGASWNFDLCITTAYLYKGIGHAMRHVDRHVISALGHGDVDRPIAALGQLGLARLKGGR